jgi:hypothetical protein
MEEMARCLGVLSHAHWQRDSNSTQQWQGWKQAGTVFKNSVETEKSVLTDSVSF